MSELQPTLYQNYIALSRYARYRPDLGRRETWGESVDRLIDFWRGRLSGYVDDETFDKVREFIVSNKVMPSMRSLMTAGEALTRDEVAGYNCAYTACEGVGPEVALWDSKLQDMGFDEPIHVALRTPIVFDCILYVLLCFHPDTLVTCDTGAKRIADILPGDKVQSFNESTGCFEWREVTATVITPSAARKKVRVTLENGSTFDCTADHKWLTANRGWVEAQHLTAEDDLVSPKFAVYEHTCKSSNKSYIGYTGKGVDIRWGQHVAASANKNARDYNTHFHRAIRKYGAECWDTRILQWAWTEKAAQAAEIQWIANSKPQYNMTSGGEGTSGLSWSEESRAKASENAYERTDAHRKAQGERLKEYQPKIIATRRTEEYRQAQAERNKGERNPMFGRKHDEKRLEQLRQQSSGSSNPFFGKQHSEESKEKLRQAIRARGSQLAEKNPFFGKKHSEETKAKMRQAKAERRAARGVA